MTTDRPGRDGLDKYSCAERALSQEQDRELQRAQCAILSTTDPRGQEPSSRDLAAEWLAAGVRCDVQESSPAASAVAAGSLPRFGVQLVLKLAFSVLS